MAILLATIGALIIGGVSNSTAGFISFVVIWILVSAYEEMEMQVNALRRRVGELQTEVENLESEANRLRPDVREKEWYEWNVL